MGVTANENGASFWGDKNVVMVAHHVFTKKQNTELHFWVGRFSAMWIYSIKILKKQLRLRFSFFAKVTKYEGGRTGEISQPPSPFQYNSNYNLSSVNYVLDVLCSHLIQQFWKTDSRF